MSTGTMTQGWTVWCAECVAWDQVSGSKASAASAFKASGWRKVRGRWVCRECLQTAKLNESKDIEREKL